MSAVPRHSLLVYLLCACVSACSSSAITGPSQSTETQSTPTDAGSFQPLSILVGSVWSGEETAQVGESGTLTATFTAEPTGANVFIRLTWHSNRLNLDYQGEVTGALDALHIRATSNPGGGTLCGYEAGAVVNAAGDVITGNYGGSGNTAPCSTKRGTFVLRKHAPVPPTVLVDCLTPGVITNATMVYGVATFTVTQGPVELSLVVFRVARPIPPRVNHRLQEFVRHEVYRFTPGTYTWSMQPWAAQGEAAVAFPFRQEDLFCGAYPAGEPLTDANFDYWEKRTLAWDFGLVR